MKTKLIQRIRSLERLLGVKFDPAEDDVEEGTLHKLEDGVLKEMKNKTQK